MAVMEHSGSAMRFRVNLVSVLASFAIVFVAVRVSDGSFATRISKIGKDLNRDLSTVIDQSKPNFTELNHSGSYASETVFDARGMGGLYNITNAFMEAVLAKNDIYPSGFIRIEQNKVEVGDIQEEWKNLLKQYGGLLAMIIVLLLALLLLPLAGLCFCCCRCCGNCGAKSQPYDKRRDLCKKIVLATLLICLGTMLLFGVVCAFVSNEQLNEGMYEVAPNLRSSISDVKEYLGVTDRQAKTLLQTNYLEFEFVLLKTINSSTEIVFDQLAVLSNATAMTSLVYINKQIPLIQKNFVTLKYSANVLRVYASMLNDAVRGVKRDLLDTLNSKACSSLPQCQDLQKKINNLTTDIHFDRLPDISSSIEQLDTLMTETKFDQLITNGEQELNKIKDKIHETVNTTMSRAQEKIEEAGREIQKGYTNISSVITDLKSGIDDNTYANLDDANDYIVKYMPYRYYGGLALSCILLLISICITLGLICGICGKKPDAYGNDCCNKGAGSQFLICGVWIMFLSSFVIAAVVLVSFLSGILVQRIGCDSLRDPEHSQVFDVINKVNLSNYDVNISEILTNCHRNKSIYQVLHLEKYFNLSEVTNYVETFKIDEILDQLNLSQVNTSIQILNPDDAKKLVEQAHDNDFSHKVNWDEFTQLMDKSFTSVSLKNLSAELGSVIANPLMPADLQIRLNLSRMQIDTYQERIVDPMTANATLVVQIAKETEILLKFNHSSFSEAVNFTVVEIQQAEAVLNHNGTDTLKKVAKQFTSSVVGQVKDYLYRVGNKTEEEVGRCGPLSLVLNATLTATCDKILLPWNGYWFGLFWSLLLFLPMIIISVKLSTLYQKFNPYSAPLVEAEYLYDAYADRDSIPLNSRNGKSKKKNKKQKHYEDRTAGDLVARDYAAPSHQDQRYQDMAPKHWEDFPAGGPPQYQRAPTEYERPPPYYYPAAGETNP